MKSSHSERDLERRLVDHKAAVGEFIEKAGALNAAQWLTPRGEGKWTPAQETTHVILAYDSFLSQLNGGPPMRLRGTPWKRRVWRLIGLNSILWRKRIPVAVNAPREVRPEWEPAPAAELLPRLRRRAEEFDTVFASKWRAEPRSRVTHFMFGELVLDQAIQLMSIHTRHHAALLPLPRQTAGAPPQ